MKEFRSTADLVSLLADERGLHVADRGLAEQALRRINYYRFTGYSRHFQVDPRNGDNRYVSGATFDDVIGLIRTDDDVRLKLFVALCELEQVARTRFAHLAGRIFGNGAFFLRPENHISDSDDTQRRIGRLKCDLAESKHPTVVHYRRGDDVSAVPVWVAVEVLSFGKVSWLIESLDSSQLREELADFFAYSRAPFPRVMQSLSALRNTCAHHGQVWNRNLTAQCPLPLNKRERPRDIAYHPQSLYPAIMALRKLVTQRVSVAALDDVEVILRRADGYASGVLQPQGVR